MLAPIKLGFLGRYRLNIDALAAWLLLALTPAPLVLATLRALIVESHRT
jgi:hypothetical protein